ncbi:unnamed protein product, partial [Meganyctiphanes norvegica]
MAARRRRIVPKSSFLFMFKGRLKNIVRPRRRPHTQVITHSPKLIATMTWLAGLEGQPNTSSCPKGPAKVLNEQTCTEQTFTERTFTERTFMEQTFTERTFTERTFMGLLTSQPYILRRQNHTDSGPPQDYTGRSHDRFTWTKQLPPMDGRQVFLQMVGGKGESQYINAVRVNGLRQRDAILVTEHPMIHTVHQAWRMAYEKRVGAWLLLQETQQDTQEYPPLVGNGSNLSEVGAESRAGQLVIRLDKLEDHAHFTAYTLMLKSAKATLEAPHGLKVLQLKDWLPDNALPTGGSSTALNEAFTYVDAMTAAAAAAAAPSAVSTEASGLSMSLQAAKPPIILTCCDGASACGVAAALYIVRERIKVTGDIDVYRAVQGILYDRPQFIAHLEQYVFLHNASKEVIKEKKTGAKTRDIMMTKESKENGNIDSSTKSNKNDIKLLYQQGTHIENSEKNKEGLNDNMINKTDATESEVETTDSSSSSGDSDTSDENVEHNIISLTHPKARICYSY